MASPLDLLAILNRSHAELLNSSLHNERDGAPESVAFVFLQVQQLPCPIWYLGVTFRLSLAVFDKEFPTICLCSIYPPCAIILGEASIITARAWCLQKFSIRVPNCRIILECAECLNVLHLHPDAVTKSFTFTDSNSGLQLFCSTVRTWLLA